MSSSTKLWFVVRVCPIQNKCTRYWPDENDSKVYGNLHVLNLKEISNPHYVLREFLIHQDSEVSLLLLLLPTG